MTTSYTQQVAFRGRNDDQTLNSTTWTYTQNSNWSQAVDITFRVRLQAEEINSKVETVAGQLEASLNGGIYFNVTTSSTIVKAVASTYSINDVAVTPKQLTGSARTFTGGWGCEDGLTANVSINNSCLEHEYAVQIVGADVANGDTITIRIASLDGYVSTPSITVLKTTSLVVSSPINGQTSSNIDLKQNYTAIVSNAVETQTSDIISLSQHYLLVVSSATQVQTSDNLVLTTTLPPLGVISAIQSQSSDNIVLVQHHILSIYSSVQTQTSNNIDLSQGFILSTNNAIQAQSSDNILLIQNYILVVMIATQLQTSDNITFVAGGIAKQMMHYIRLRRR